MKELLKIALGINHPWEITDVRFDVELRRLDIGLTFKRGSRFEFEGTACPVYDTIPKSWRHLNFFEHECYLHADVPRVRTSDGRTIMILPPWSGKLGGFTLLFESLLVELCKHTPVNQVSKLVSVSNRRLWRLLNVYVEAARYFEDWSEVSVLGIDETSVCKGHEYVALFVDIERKRTLHVARGKDKETVKEFVSVLKDHNGLPTKIKEVSCDMSRSFIAGVKKNLPNANITFDKFHIIKIINEGVDAVRRQEAKQQPILKGKRYAILKNDKNLTTKQKQDKESLNISELNLKTMEAVRMRENFQAIYKADDVKGFVKLLRQWIKWVENCNLKPMEKAAHSIVRHQMGIIRWKKSQINNGLLEGLNSVLQAAKRKARGYKYKNFCTMAYLITGKLSLDSINKYCKPT